MRCFDPIGLWIPRGQRVRWHVQSGAHKVSAYHPSNGRELRIPEEARAWSVYLDSGCPEIPETFEYTFEVEGVYDYFCEMHEEMGMVGRIIVGEPKGPGTKPLEQGIPKAAWAFVPSVELIMRGGKIPFPKPCPA